jgi:type VII secretion protein EccB
VPSHKDLLQAHRLMTQRSALALISGEPDSPNQPLRRLNVGTISGLLVGAIAAAVFAVLGLISPGSATASATGLTRAGTLVVDSASATAYVPCDSGKLCPALNYTSALLALDSASVRRVNVSPAALAHYSIGPTIGVAGLPQDLPVAQNLVIGPWAVCATSAGTTLVGGRPVGGTTLGSASAALATTGQGDVWVLWDGQRLAIQPSVAQTLFPAMQIQTVPAAWLNALPEGSPFAAPNIPGQGTEVNGPEGFALVGQVFDQAGSGGAVDQYYVLLADGKLAQITATQAQLLAREPGAPATQAISPSLATANLSQTTIPRGALPATIPAVAPIRSALCVTYGANLQRHIVTGATVPSGATPTSSTAHTQVWLPPAHGALIGAAPGATSSGVTTYFLLTAATRYALPAQSVASVLGYNLKSQSAVLPAGILDLLPAGPPLNPTAATKPTAGQGQ